MDKNIDMPILLDLYGGLLSPSQREDAESYYNSDLSLSEIAQNVGKSRQGVFESVKRAESVLADAENKLGFRDKISKTKKDFTEIERLVKECCVFENNDVLKKITDITKKHTND